MLTGRPLRDPPVATRTPLSRGLPTPPPRSLRPRGGGCGGEFRLGEECWGWAGCGQARRLQSLNGERGMA
eukprot:3753593-Alexandrium_andersonii.AAC.1